MSAFGRPINDGQADDARLEGLMANHLANWQINAWATTRGGPIAALVFVIVM